MAKTKKTKFNVAELLTLDAELTGTPQQVGLLSQKLSLVTKYHLTKIAKLTAEEKAEFEKLRTGLVQELGEDDGNGMLRVPEWKTVKGKKGEADKAEPHPNFIKFRTQLEELFAVEKEIEHADFSIEDFATLETEGNYPIFFKLLGLE